MITIKLKNGLRAEEEQWLSKNVGPKLHYIHNSVGGVGWIAKRSTEEIEFTDSRGNTSRMHVIIWNLTFQDDRYATWFRILFPE
jgi:hypothetical protein